jgi:hypothetical protein
VKRVLIAIMLLSGTAHAQEPRPRLELPQQTLTDGDKVKLGPMSIPSSKAQRDQRPLMIGGGIVVLAAAMWWNRKRRERFDRTDATESARATDDTTNESREDTDDLQAAARGEQKDNET